MKIIKPRGTQDICGLYVDWYNYVINSCIKLAQAFGFEQAVIPTIENAELFHRNNENSDIVKKELYEFKDRGDRLIALRPEATASLIRLVGENNLLDIHPLPLKYFTYGSMFRYERPQKGRHREFKQFDVELIGPKNAYDIVQVIDYGRAVLNKINVLNETILKINFIGSFKTRWQWIVALQKYLEPHKDKLSLLSQERLKVNPLRILDDKVDGKLDFVKSAPKVTDFLSANEKANFNKILQLLDDLKISYEIDIDLVRGLDYYTDVVFEFVNTNNNNQQSTVIAGGLYDGLIKEITGHDLQGIGLAIGLDRCVEMLSEATIANIDLHKPKRLFLVVLDKKYIGEYYQKVSLWRNEMIRIFYDPEINKIDKAIKLAARMKYNFLGIIGQKEYQEKTIQIKDLSSRNQEIIKESQLQEWWNKVTK